MKLDRRQIVKGGLAYAAGLIAFPGAGAGRQAGVTKLTGSVSVLVEGGTNVVVLAAGDGLILVDSGAPERGSALMSQVSELGSSRVRAVFNTHYHPENTGSNEVFGSTGAKIVAHAHTREWMATPYWVPAEDRYQKPRPAAALPTETFYTTGSMKAGAEPIDFGYLIEAHTSGDIYVFFRNANVLAIGDAAAPVRDPELDYFTGAWIGGRVDAMDLLLKLSNDDTRIVPGFGPVMNRAELKAERDMMAAIYDRTVDRVREGDSAQDMLEAGVLDGLGRTFKDPRKFLYDVHKGLWAHHNKLAPNVV